MANKDVPVPKQELLDFLATKDVKNCPAHNCCELVLANNMCCDMNENIYKIMQSNDENIRDYIKKLKKCDQLRQSTAPKIFEMVEELASSLIASARVVYPPVPDTAAMAACKEHTIEIRLVPMEKYQGALWDIDKHWVIQLNKNASQESRRISLFHEVFHILTFEVHQGVQNMGGGNRFFYDETLSDFFAGCVLMPRDWVAAKWQESQDVNKIARIFGVSFASAYRRLQLYNLVY